MSDEWGTGNEREQTVYNDLTHRTDAILRVLNIAPRDVEERQVPASVRRLVAEGRLIEAIKEYRERTGCGLKEAKEAVMDNEFTLSWPVLHAKLDRILAAVGGEGETTVPGLNAEQTADIEDMLTSGNFVGAVMVYRDYTGATLDDAQDTLREMNARLHRDEDDDEDDEDY